MTVLQVQARRGENINSESGMWPGYDPALQVCEVKIYAKKQKVTLAFAINSDLG